MAEPVTKVTAVDPADFIAAVEPASGRQDAKLLDAIFQRVTGEPPRMWRPSIIGYGSYRYRYASGHEARAPRVGFDPRKARHSPGAPAPGITTSWTAFIARCLGRMRGGASIGLADSIPPRESWAGTSPWCTHFTLSPAAPAFQSSSGAS